MSDDELEWNEAAESSRHRAPVLAKKVAAGIGVVVVLLIWGFGIAHDDVMTSPSPAQVMQPRD